MLPRDRVLSTFENKRIDKIPVHHIGFSGHAASIILGRQAYVGGQIQWWREMNALWEGPGAHKTFLERSRKDAVDVALACEHDIIRLQYWRWSVKPTRKMDKYTFLFGDPKKNWYVMKFDPKIELFHRTDGYGSAIIQCRVSKEFREEELETIVKSHQKEIENYYPSQSADPVIQATLKEYKDYAIRNWVLGVGIEFDQFWLEALGLRPDLVARYVNIQAEKAIRQIPGLAASGIRLVFGGGDFASNEGPMYSPRVFHDIVLPALKKITKICHRYGVYYVFLSDGNLWPVADDLFGASGIDGYGEIDRQAGMGLRTLRQQFPDLTLIGNISSHTLYRSTRKQVIEEVLSCIDVAKKFGRIIVGASNYSMPGTPRENIMAMIDTIKKNR